MSSEIDPHTYNHIIYNKVTTGEQRKEDAVRQLHVLMEKINLDPYLTSYTKINSVWIMHNYKI